MMEAVNTSVHNHRLPAVRFTNIPLILAIAFFCGLLPCIYSVKDISILYCMLTGLNGFVTAYFLLYDASRPFTVAKLINFFILVFFILANAVQYANNTVVLTFSHWFTDSDYELFQFIVFLILMTFNTLHDFFMSRTKVSHKEAISFRYNTMRLVLLSAAATFLVFVYYRFNIFTLLFRGIVESMLEERGLQGGNLGGGTASNLIFEKVIRSIPWSVYILSNCIECSKNKRRILFLFTLITVFPLALARNAAAMYWIPIFLVLLDRYIRGNRFVYTMLAGIFVAFPFLENFRNYNGKINFGLSFDFLNSMHMDASQIFMATMDLNVITWGRQLAGAMLFFFPRALWPGKPIGSGAFLVTEMDGSFTNVSMPFFSEGFINFGFPGILLFTLLLAYISGFLDRKFWNSHNRGKFLPVDGYYLIILSAIIFIMRGDLMSSFAYTVGLAISYWLTLKLCRKKIKNKL